MKRMSRKGMKSEQTLKLPFQERNIGCSGERRYNSNHSRRVLNRFKCGKKLANLYVSDSSEEDRN